MNKNYNSFLFVPATERLLPKIATAEADAVIVDLEDAVLPENKDKALGLLQKFLAENPVEKDIFVRINPDRMVLETNALNKFQIKGYMLPKTESECSAMELKKLAEGKKIIALIESAKGILRAEEIAASDAVDMIAFGAEDYTTQCNIKNSAQYLMYPKSKIVACAKAYNKLCIDTISLNIKDEDSYKEEVISSQNFGFDAKLAIHPMQVRIINEIFSQNKLEYYKFVVEQYEKCGEGVLNLQGKVFEKPHIDKMRKIIRESENEN